MVVWSVLARRIKISQNIRLDEKYRSKLISLEGLDLFKSSFVRIGIFVLKSKVFDSWNYFDTTKSDLAAQFEIRGNGPYVFGSNLTY